MSFVDLLLLLLLLLLGFMGGFGVVLCAAMYVLAALGARYGSSIFFV